MHILKRISAHSLAAILASVLLLAAAGCGGSDAVSAVVDTSPAETEPAPAAADTAEPADAGEVDEDHAGDEDHDDEHDDHDGESSGGLGAHVHGAADLFVAWSGPDVVVDLVSPSNNVFGFEYEPTSDEDLAIVEEQTAMLTAPGVLVLDEAAACALAAPVVTELEFEGTHAEVTASWLFTCEQPDELTQLDATVLFASFPGFEDIDAQWASDTGQSAAELTPTSTILQFD